MHRKDVERIVKLVADLKAKNPDLSVTARSAGTDMLPIRMWQDRRGTGLGVATELGPVDFTAIARLTVLAGPLQDTAAEIVTAQS